MAAITRSLDLLESVPPAAHLDIGSITIGCALGYLDLRHGAMRGRDSRPRLARWEAEMAAAPEMTETAPPPA